MLRRAENVNVYYKRDLLGLFTGRFRILLEVGRKIHLSPNRVTVGEFRAMQARSSQTPVAYLRVGDRTYWRSADKWYTDNEGLAAEAVHALLVTRAMRQDDRVNRAMTIAAQGQLPVPDQRTGIPKDVKLLVWNRDQGSCRACGSKVDLQFDHIIPVSHGGSSTEHNLQILCGTCNRRKGASVV
ncbi:MAG: hypothetical protein QOF82_3452 [Frankiales bacterium]|nr:hypothetical protein [Frankiales bacterium]